MPVLRLHSTDSNHRQASDTEKDVFVRFEDEPEAYWPALPASPLSNGTARSRARSERNDIAKPLRWFMLTDLLAFIAAYLLAKTAASAINELWMARSLISLGTQADSLRFGQFFALAFSVMLWFEHTGHYLARRPLAIETRQILGALAIAMALDGFLQFAAKQDFSRLWLTSGWLFAALALPLFRQLGRKALRAKGWWQARVLLVGNGPLADKLRQTLQAHPELGYRIRAQVDDLALAFAKANESWETLCALGGADYVLIALEGQALDRAELPLAQLMRESIPFAIAPPLQTPSLTGGKPISFINHDVLLMTLPS